MDATIMIRPISMALTCLLAVTLVGCRDGFVRGDSPLPPLPEDLPDAGVIGPMDVLDIRVYDEPELSGEYRIDADGTVTFPFLGGVQLAGMTPNETATLIAEGLANGYIVDPVVSVFVKEANSRRVYVLGHVKKPGSFPYSDGMTLVAAIALAGGVETGGAANRTKIARQIEGQELRFTVQLEKIANGEKPDVVLMPSDIVYVPASAL